MINPRYPFGGYKRSGIGREHGKVGFDEYREVKHIHVDMAGGREAHKWWDVVVPSGSEGQTPKGETRPGG